MLVPLPLLLLLLLPLMMMMMTLTYAIHAIEKKGKTKEKSKPKPKLHFFLLNDPARPTRLHSAWLGSARLGSTRPELDPKPTLPLLIFIINFANTSTDGIIINPIWLEMNELWFVLSWAMAPSKREAGE